MFNKKFPQSTKTFTNATPLKPMNDFGKGIPSMSSTNNFAKPMKSFTPMFKQNLSPKPFNPMNLRRTATNQNNSFVPSTTFGNKK